MNKKFIIKNFLVCCRGVIARSLQATKQSHHTDIGIASPTSGWTRNDKRKQYSVFFSSLVIIAVLIHTVGGFAVSNTALVNAVKSSFNHWNVMAQVALGETPSNARDLCNQVNESSQAIDISGRILGLTAASIDPRTCSTNLVSALKVKVSNNQIGDPLLINDDIFAGLALISAGEPLNDSAVQVALSTVKNNQQANGSFGYAVGGGDDVDMTSAAVAFLRAAGSDISKAVAYLKQKQNNDGGFPAYGQTVSNMYSSSWVGAFAQGSSWSNGGATLAQYLEKDATTLSAAFRIIAEQGYIIPLRVIQPSQVASSSSANSQGNQVNTGAPNTVDRVYVKIRSDAFSECSTTASVTTPLQAVVDAGKNCGLSVTVVDTTLGKYVSSIGGKAAGGTSGWMYAINDRKGDGAAGEYRLMFGDKVLWFYGNAQDSAPAFGVASSTVSGAVVTQASVSLTATVDIPQQVSGVPSGGEPAREARIDVDQSSASFGTLRRGEKTSVRIPVSNRGGVDLTIGAQVSGSDLFTQNLEINNTYWADFQSSLGVNEQKILDVGVSVPSAYSKAGTHNGEMIIWGKAR